MTKSLIPKRLTPKLAAAAAAGTLLLGSAAAVAATSAGSTGTTKGTLHVWVTPGKGATDMIVLTGAIGDYGKAISVTKSGKVDKNGAYVHVKLQNGSFYVNAKKFNNEASATKPHNDLTTCSSWATLTGPVTLYDGSGAYANISGKLHISTSFAAVFPRYTHGSKKGQCKTGNHLAPVAAFSGQITGSGHVSYGS